MFQKDYIFKDIDMAMAKITTKKVQTVDSNGKSEIDLSMNFKKKYFLLTFLWHFWY